MSCLAHIRKAVYIAIALKKEDLQMESVHVQCSNTDFTT